MAEEIRFLAQDISSCGHISTHSGLNEAKQSKLTAIPTHLGMNTLRPEHLEKKQKHEQDD